MTRSFRQLFRPNNYYRHCYKHLATTRNPKVLRKAVIIIYLGAQLSRSTHNKYSGMGRNTYGDTLL